MEQWPTLDPGAMIHWVTLFEGVAGTDASGSTITWKRVLQLWAQIDPVRGAEVIRSGQDTTQLYLVVKVRWQPGIRADMRLDSLNGSYIIQSIENPGERNIMLVLNCLALGKSQ